MDREVENWLAGAEYDLETAKSLTPGGDGEDFVAELSNLSIATRYPDDFQDMVAEFTGEKAGLILDKTEELFKWIAKSSKR